MNYYMYSEESSRESGSENSESEDNTEEEWN